MSVEATQCELRIRGEESNPTLQVRGRGTLTQAATLRRYGEAVARNGGGLRLDLRYCSYLDSTMLGTLLCLNRSLGQRGMGLTLVSPAPVCRHLLRQVGLESLLAVAEEDEPVDAAWTPLPVEKERNVATFKRQVLECHEELARVGGSGSEEFRRAADCLGRELA